MEGFRERGLLLDNFNQTQIRNKTIKKTTGIMVAGIRMVTNVSAELGDEVELVPVNR